MYPEGPATGQLDKAFRGFTRAWRTRWVGTQNPSGTVCFRCRPQFQILSRHSTPTVTKFRHNVALQTENAAQKFTFFPVLHTYSPFSINLPSSLPNALPCLLPAYTRRTSEHSLVTFTAIIVSPYNNKCSHHYT